MSEKLIKYTFSASGPLPDENGVIMQGTAVRIERIQGEARAYDIKHAVELFLNCPEVKAIAEYNGIEVEGIINDTSPTIPNFLSILFLDNGLAVSFSLKEKEEQEDQISATEEKDSE